MPLSKVNRPGLNTGIADSSDATAITIDSSERVGVGNSSPSVPLDILTSGSGATLKIQGSADNFLQVGTSGVSAYVQGTSSANAARFGALSGHSVQIVSNSAAQLCATFDTSGRVTMPNQPSFVTRVTASTTTAGAKWPTNGTPQHNIGNHWSTTTHRFTAPVAGRYLLLCSGYTNFTPSYGYMNLYINGTNQGHYSRHFNHNNTQQHDGLSMNVIWNLNANDYVEWGRAGAGGGYFDIVNVGAYLLG